MSGKKCETAYVREGMQDRLCQEKIARPLMSGKEWKTAYVRKKKK